MVVRVPVRLWVLFDVARKRKKMKQAVVVGASSGIGREVARLLLRQGWSVGLAARREEPLQALADDYPGQAWVQVIDVTSDDGPRALMQLVSEMGGMDLYFHAAGVGWQNHTLEAPKELATLATNGDGFARMVGEAYRYFAKRGGGHIAVISSIAGTKGLGPAPAYSATKAFQNVYVQALEQQARMRRLPIRFTDIRPGFVRTGLLGDGASYPMLMEPREVAEAIVRAVVRGRHVCVIDWRYRLLTFFWRLIPAALWRRMRIQTK